MSQYRVRAKKRQRLHPSDRRVLLMDAAAHAFGRLGVEGTRMDDVAAEAGVAKGLLYRHFPSKDALLEALMERKGAEFSARLQQRLTELDAAHGTPGQLVTEGLRLWIEQVASDIASFNWIETGAAGACTPFWDEVHRFVTERILSVAPSIDHATASLVASALQAVAEAVTTAWRQQPQAIPREELLSLLVAFCVGGLNAVAQSLGVAATLDPPASHRSRPRRP